MAALIRSGRFACLLTSRLVSRPRFTNVNAVRDAHRLAKQNITKQGLIQSSLSSRWCSNAVATEDEVPAALEEAVENGSPQDTSLRRQLEVLNHMAKSTGRVSSSKVFNACNMLSKTIKMDSIDGAMLLRCTGKLLVRLTPEERHVKFQKVWRKLESIGTTFDIVHYNAALRAQLENGRNISPPEFLAEVEGKGIIPNRLTYQLLIVAYCKDADVEGASKILEHMQKQNMAIGEWVFQSLVMGYMKQGNVEGAKEVLQTMKGSGLDPSADTYCTMACGFAEKGDFDGVIQTMKETAADDVSLKTKHYCQLVETLAENHHNEHVQEVIKMLSEGNIFAPEIINTTLKLITQGHDTEAVQLYNVMSPPFAAPADHPVVQEFFMKDKPLAEILSLLPKLTSFEKGLSNDDWDSLALLAIRIGRYSLARDILQHMNNHGKDLQPHQLWPILKGENNPEEILKTIALCKTLYEKEEVAVIDICSHAAVKLRAADSQDMKEIMEKLQSFGYSDSAVKSFGFYIHVAGGQFEDAMALAKDEEIIMSPRLVKPLLLIGYKNDGRNMDRTIDVLEALQQMFPTNVVLDINSKIFLNFLLEQNLNTEQVEEMINFFVDKEIKVLDRFEPAIIRQLNRHKVSEEAKKKKVPTATLR